MVSSQVKTDITPIKIEQKGLEKLLRQVNPNKASGPDTIPNRILKECAEPIAPILQIILQQSSIRVIFEKTGGMQIYQAYSKKGTNIFQRTTDRFH